MPNIVLNNVSSVQKTLWQIQANPPTSMITAAFLLVIAIGKARIGCNNDSSLPVPPFTSAPLFQGDEVFTYMHNEVYITEKGQCILILWVTQNNKDS